MLFSWATEAEHQGSGDAFVLPPALLLPHARSQPRLSPDRGHPGQPEGTIPLLGALAALHQAARMLPRGSCCLCYSQRKRGNLGTKAAELRHSLALFGDTSSGTVSRRERGSHCLALAVPFLKAHGAAGLVRGRCWGWGDRSRGLLEQMLFWRGGGSWQGRDPPAGPEPGRGERFCSWLIPQPAATGGGRVTVTGPPGPVVPSG